ncbi:MULTISPECIES: YbaB/EbfC family nucleoid-associated protein [Thermocrispum]|jgi:hypothetical protein|uniref:YbaB/EbfC family nucleoid-associated protein n=1 Tax=Thermocrispum agreste TaxID=37925 RepID=A0ABD6FI00_9PSEU|nr:MULTISPECIES: YbaB/EbfC family nucleoid-associated protein [Thermocrispum]
MTDAVLQDALDREGAVTEYRARVDELLGEYRRGREQLAGLHRTLRSITATASTPDGSVSATVGPRGTLTGLTITEQAYQRFTPAELAEQIVRLAGQAAASAVAKAGAVLAPALPSGVDPEALLLGTGDLSPAEIRAGDDRAAEPAEGASR